MIAKIIPCCLALIFSALPLAASEPPELSARLDASTPYGVPGFVLPTGSFSINILDHLRDRYIVQIQSSNGAKLATFLGVPSKAIGPPENGKVVWPSSSKGVSYLRGWYFSKAKVGMEFVYSKTDAVAIAQANNANVAAIDPASDGLTIAAPAGLSQQDLQIVTLWLLTPTRVGASHVASIEAKRYDSQPQTAAPQVASVPAPAPPQQVASAEPPAQVASVAPHRRGGLHALPHTASNLGWFYLFGALSFAGALGLGMKRVSYGG